MMVFLRKYLFDEEARAFSDIPDGSIFVFVNDVISIGDCAYICIKHENSYIAIGMYGIKKAAPTARVYLAQ